MYDENCPEEDPGKLNKEYVEDRNETRKAKLQGRRVVTKRESIGDGH